MDNWPPCTKDRRAIIIAYMVFNRVVVSHLIMWNCGYTSDTFKSIVVSTSGHSGFESNAASVAIDVGTGLPNAGSGPLTAGASGEGAPGMGALGTGAWEGLEGA